MNLVSKYFRLLPAVVVVGTGLLALKGIDLARAATAAPASAYDEPDNSGLAPSDNGGAPVKDFASDDGASGSAAEVDVLSSLTRRRAELDARERALNMRENLLTASEGRVDQKIGALKTLQTQIQALLTQRDAKQDEQIASLVKTYSTMKPKDAARIFNTLSDDVLLPVAKGMKSDVLAPVLAAMVPDAAQKLTVKLAALLKLPETAPATVCPDPAVTVPGTSADITSPVVSPIASANSPVTTALANPVVTPLPLPPAPTPTVTPAPPPAQTPPPAPATTVPPTAAPPKPQASTTPPPAHHPAKPTSTAPAKPSSTPPAKPASASATPPAKPTTATATPPAKPVATPTVTPAPAATPPAKPTTQAATAPAPTTPATAAPPASAAPTPHGG